MTLETEIETFERLVATELAGQDGKFATVSGDKLIGVFESYQDALNAGYGAAGLKPFLVKQVANFEVVANFTRDFGRCTLPA